MRENIAVIFGGKSVEHDISIITGLQCLNNLSKKYNVIPVYLQHDGTWVVGENLDTVETYLNFKKNAKKLCRASLLMGTPYLLKEKRAKFVEKIKIDCAVLATHGKFVEDGCLQGALELCGIPYTSCSVLSSAACMDKAITKLILKANKIQTPKFLHFYATEYAKFKSDIIEQLISTFNFPVIVKPASLGSSVGISICEDEQSLIKSIEYALLYDEKVIVEDYIADAKEYACAVVKVNDVPISSKVQEMTKGAIYTFEDKYLNKNGKKTTEIDENMVNRVKKLAQETYNALVCDGVVRVDFLYEQKNDILYVNELNTIPGSLAFNLFDVPFKDLLDTLILEAKERSERKDKDVYVFSSDAIKVYANLTSQNKYSK